MTTMTVIGCGYLGAVHAACMATLGHDVLGIDVDTWKVDQLNGGVAPFFEPGFPELLAEALGSGRLRFTSDMLANAQKAWPDLEYADTAQVAAREADLVMVLTEWDDYRALDPVQFGTIVAGKRILDGRNALYRDAWRAAGWTYRALGRR